MAEYIEREALMRRIKEIHCAECDSYHGVRCRACWVDDTLVYIDSEPAADVAPVVHGEWLLRHEGYGHYWECSSCHKNPCIYVTKDTRYCPNYGAKMDGGDDYAST